MTADRRFREEMDYCAPKALRHSLFLAWPEDDQDKAMAWQRLQAAECSGCGTRADEWEADPLAYLGDIVSCPGCVALDQERDNVPEGTKGVRLRLVPRAVGEARVARGEGIG